MRHSPIGQRTTVSTFYIRVSSIPRKAQPRRDGSAVSPGPFGCAQGRLWGARLTKSGVRFRAMAPVDLQPPRVKTTRSFGWLAGILTGVLVALLLIATALWAFAGFGLFEFVRMLRGGQVHISVDQPTVIHQIRALHRLETVGYTMDRIISGERENPILPRILAGDRLLLVVHGEVIAGMDLSKLQPSDVVVSGRSVSIRLPQAEIFTTRLDNAKTRVYSRDTGLFSTADPNLEGEVRQEAERQLQAAALQDGILKIADKNARQTLTSMLTGLGYGNVEIR